MKENVERHVDNLAHLHGYFYKGVYYHRGVGQPHNREKRVRSGHESLTDRFSGSDDMGTVLFRFDDQSQKGSRRP